MSKNSKQTDAVPEQTFDQRRVRCAFDRAAVTYEQAAILQNEVCKRLLEKLEIVKIDPRYILDAGSGTGSAIPDLMKRYKKAQLVALDISENMLDQSRRYGSLLRAPHQVCADIEKLPFDDGVFDLVFSSLSMQWCNDLNAVLLEAKRVLKPGGLFVFTTFGPDTLKELKSSWSGIDDKQHVNQFIDMHDIGDALLHDGYAEPVMEAEVLTVTYQSVDEIMRDLKAIGANVTSMSNGSATAQKAGLGGRTALNRVRQNYEAFRQQGLLPASYEIIYGHAWKPAGQTKPDHDKNQQFVDFVT